MAHPIRIKDQNYAFYKEVEVDILFEFSLFSLGFK